MKSNYKYLILILIAIGTYTSSSAEHLLGGGFQYEYIGQNQIKLKFKLYRDVLSNAATLENIIEVKVRRLSNNTVHNTYGLNIIKTEKVINYNNCINSFNQIEIGYYEKIIQLDSTFNDTSGYYVTWERCCRPSSIYNIVDPGSTGSVFYLSLPKLYWNSPFLKNRSTTLNYNFNNVLTTNDTIAIKFELFDNENDSALLSINRITDGIETSLFDPMPRSPAFPLNFATWSNENNLQNPISNTYFSFDSINGLMNIQAKYNGLNALAFKIEEYRNGILISESNVEYNLLFANLKYYFIQQAENVYEPSNTALFQIQHNASNANYQWQLRATSTVDFQNIANATSSYLEVQYDNSLMNYNYRCIVSSDSMACPDTSNIVGFITPLNVSITDNSEFKLYPNPVQSKLFIESKTKIEKIELFDLSGKQYFLNWDLNYADVSRLENGIYFLKIEDRLNRTYYKKIIKMN